MKPLIPTRATAMFLKNARVLIDERFQAELQNVVIRAASLVKAELENKFSKEDLPEGLGVFNVEGLRKGQVGAVVGWAGKVPEEVIQRHVDRELSPLSLGSVWRVAISKAVRDVLSGKSPDEAFQALGGKWTSEPVDGNIQATDLPRFEDFQNAIGVKGTK